MGQQPFRIEPAMPASAYKTYSIRSPRDTLIRTACEQAGCPKWRDGWETILDEADPVHAEAAGWIRTAAKRTFTERRSGALTVFRFESGQRCFEDHQTRPERYFVRGGDWRGNPRGDVRQHVRPADWQEDFGEHQQGLADQIGKG